MVGPKPNSLIMEKPYSCRTDTQHDSKNTHLHTLFISHMTQQLGSSQTIHSLIPYTRDGHKSLSSSLKSLMVVMSVHLLHVSLPRTQYNYIYGIQSMYCITDCSKDRTCTLVMTRACRREWDLARQTLSLLKRKQKIVHKSQTSSSSQVWSLLRSSLKSSLISLCMRLKCDLSPSLKCKSPSLAFLHYF